LASKEINKNFEETIRKLKEELEAQKRKTEEQTAEATKLRNELQASTNDKDSKEKKIQELTNQLGGLAQKVLTCDAAIFKSLS